MSKYLLLNGPEALRFSIIISFTRPQGTFSRLSSSIEPALMVGYKFAVSDQLRKIYFLQIVTSNCELYVLFFSLVRFDVFVIHYESFHLGFRLQVSV